MEPGSLRLSLFRWSVASKQLKHSRQVQKYDQFIEPVAESTGLAGIQVREIWEAIFSQQQQQQQQQQQNVSHFCVSEIKLLLLIWADSTQRSQREQQSKTSRDCRRQIVYVNTCTQGARVHRCLQGKHNSLRYWFIQRLLNLIICRSKHICDK